MNSEKKQNIVYYSILQLKNLKKSGKYVALSILSIHYKKNKFKISAPTWNKKTELPDGFYSVSDNLSRLL